MEPTLIGKRLRWWLWHLHLFSKFLLKFKQISHRDCKTVVLNNPNSFLTPYHLSCCSSTVPLFSHLRVVDLLVFYLWSSVSLMVLEDLVDLPFFKFSVGRNWGLLGNFLSAVNQLDSSSDMLSLCFFFNFIVFFYVFSLFSFFFLFFWLVEARSVGSSSWWLCFGGWGCGLFLGLDLSLFLRWISAFSLLLGQIVWTLDLGSLFPELLASTVVFFLDLVF